MNPRLLPWAFGISVLLTLGWAIGRWTGDLGFWTGLLFYIPTPLLVLIWLFWIPAYWGRGSRWASPWDRRAAWLVTLLALLAGAYLLLVEMRWHSADADPGFEHGMERAAYTLVHWNVFRNHLPWQAKIERLRHERAQIYVLNEVPRQVSRGNWALRLGPNMEYAQADLMVVACQGRLLDHRAYYDRGLSTLEADCRIDGHPLRVLAVDMPADPTVVRAPLLERLVALIEERRPDLIAGDFNAPRRSLRLRRLPAGYVHAYETVGRGWPYTWPMPWPMLAIDQCILGPRAKPLEHRYTPTLSSDHLVQVLRFGVEP